MVSSLGRRGARGVQPGRWGCGWGCRSGVSREQREEAAETLLVLCSCREGEGREEDGRRGGRPFLRSCSYATDLFASHSVVSDTL